MAHVGKLWPVSQVLRYIQPDMGDTWPAVVPDQFQINVVAWSIDPGGLDTGVKTASLIGWTPGDRQVYFYADYSGTSGLTVLLGVTLHLAPDGTVLNFAATCTADGVEQTTLQEFSSHLSAWDETWQDGANMFPAPVGIAYPDQFTMAPTPWP